MYFQKRCLWCLKCFAWFIEKLKKGWSKSGDLNQPFVLFLITRKAGGDSVGYALGAKCLRVPPQNENPVLQS